MARGGKTNSESATHHVSNDWIDEADKLGETNGSNTFIGWTKAEHGWKFVLIPVQ